MISHINRHHILVSILAIALFNGVKARASITSDLINKQLDTQQNLSLDCTLPDAMEKISNQTGVPLKADPAVSQLLPWGDQTSIKANIKNHTLREGLTAITQNLGLVFDVHDESVVLHASPALARLGQRATVNELAVLALMSRTPLALDHPTLKQLVSAVNAKLAELKSPFAIDNRADDALQDQKINVASNTTLADLMEDITQQTNATWYPWGKTILIVSKQEQIRSQLSNKTITARYNGVDAGQVLLELFQHAGVDFTVEPGAYEKIPASARSITLLLDNASIQQSLESISGYTGLAFDITDKGVHVSYQADAITRPAK
jgi:hypothetical protein